MPDLDERLDERLGAARADLLSQIKALELDDIRRRARTIRRRRHSVVAGAALAFVMAVSLGVVLLGNMPSNQQPQPGGTPTPTLVPQGPVWRGGGLTLYGLSRPWLELPGRITAVEFADSGHGYAVVADCQQNTPGCLISFAVTTDAGNTWSAPQPPVRQLPQAPNVIPVGDEGVVLRAGAEAWFSDNGGRTWRPTEVPANPPLVDRIAAGARLVLDDTGTGCTARRVDVWQPSGQLGQLRVQPGFDVCWVASEPAADGSWWVGGVDHSGGQAVPVAAVTRNEGRSWRPQWFPAVAAHPGAWVRVSTLGGDAFATIVGVTVDATDPASLTVYGSYRRPANGEGFQPYGDGPGLGILAGDLVPLLDGRLVAASTEHWMVSEQDGKGFKAAVGMPAAARVQRTGPYWAAYDLFLSGWVAISADGETWHKLPLK